ncbi:sodium-dependent transporter, partial [Eggerthella lenta]|nr:sodium-dependent transporter [Eggerthella lenta]
VLFAGLSSLVNLFEAPIATLQDNLHFSRAKAVTVIGIIGVVGALCIQGIVSGWMDFVSIYICPLGAGLA